MAISSGTLGSIRSMQAKYVNRKCGYSALDFANEGGLLCGLTIFLISVFYFF